MLTTTTVLTTAQMRATENAAIASGAKKGAALMETAGRAVAGQIRLRWPVPGHATVLCGPGNNGGDGYVIARHLHRAGWRVHVLGMRGKAAGDAHEAAEQWLRLGPVLPLTLDHLRDGPESDVYIDAIFGTGLTRAPSPPIDVILEHLADERFVDRIVAVDCPSGLCLDSGVYLGQPREGFPSTCPRAVLTVAFDSPKPGHLLAHGPIACGTLVIADLGLQPWRQTHGAPFTAISPMLVGSGQPDHDWLSKRIGGGHKFSHGSAVIIAGDAGAGGAARLSARAALRVGAGLVTICPASRAMSEHAQPPDALMRKPIDMSEDMSALLQDNRIAALCIGPGCGIQRAADLLPALLSSKKPAVMDADALSAFASQCHTDLHRNCILTPHMGEFARLFPDLAEHIQQAPQNGPAYSKPEAVREAARRSDAVVLLKGPDTVIADPDGQVLIHSAFDIPWLATAGAGDVLSGIITGLLSRGLPPFTAASLGAALHAQAARRFGPGMIADDLPEELPSIFLR